MKFKAVTLFVFFFSLFFFGGGGGGVVGVLNLYTCFLRSPVLSLWTVDRADGSAICQLVTASSSQSVGPEDSAWRRSVDKRLRFSERSARINMTSFADTHCALLDASFSFFRRIAHVRRPRFRVSPSRGARAAASTCCH